MNASNRRTLWAVLAALICILLIGALLVSAQSTPPSIPIGENQTGSLTSASSTSLFSVTVTTPQNVNVLILATSPGFAPAFRVLDPNNVVIFDAANAAAQNIVQSQVPLASPGLYIIEVRSANNSTGQFTLSVQPGAPLIAPIPLPLDTPVSATVDPQDTQKVYSFTALSTDALFVEASSTLPTSGPVIRLVDADTGDTFGVANAHLTLARFRMPVGATNYLLYVTHSGSTFPETVTICLWPEHGPSCSGSGGTVAQNPTAVATSTGACTCEFTATSTASVNIRVFPSLLSAAIAVLPPNTPVQIVGELPNHTWIKVEYNGVIGWVAASAVTVTNTCPGIPLVTPTPPPNQPTPTPTTIRLGLPTPNITRPSNTPPPPPQPTSTPVLRLGPPTNTPTPRFHLQPSLVFNPPTPTPTHIIIR